MATPSYPVRSKPSNAQEIKHTQEGLFSYNGEIYKVTLYCDGNELDNNNDKQWMEIAKKAMETARDHNLLPDQEHSVTTIDYSKNEIHGSNRQEQLNATEKRISFPNNRSSSIKKALELYLKNKNKEYEIRGSFNQFTKRKSCSCNYIALSIAGFMIDNDSIPISSDDLDNAITKSPSYKNTMFLDDSLIKYNQKNASFLLEKGDSFWIEKSKVPNHPAKELKNFISQKIISNTAAHNKITGILTTKMQSSYALSITSNGNKEITKIEFFDSHGLPNKNPQKADNPNENSPAYYKVFQKVDDTSDPLTEFCNFFAKEMLINNKEKIDAIEDASPLMTFDPLTSSIN